MTFIKAPSGDTIIKRPDFGTSVRMRKPSAPQPTTSATPTPTQQTIMVFVGEDAGLLLPADVTELYLSAEDPCLVRLDHNGATPVAEGEFEFGLLGNCVETEIIYDQGDTIGALPACSGTMDLVVECAPSDPEDSGSPLIPWLIVRNASLEIIASRPLDDVLPPIPLTINGVNVGTVSRCSDGIEVSVTGECVWTEESCTGSGTVSVDDGQGNSYAEGFGC